MVDAIDWNLTKMRLTSEIWNLQNEVPPVWQEVFTSSKIAYRSSQVQEAEQEKPQRLTKLLQWATKKSRGPLLSMKYWLFNRDPYNGLL